MQVNFILYQCMEDVSLMKMDGDKGLELGTLDLSQFFCCHIDQHVQDLLKVVVSCLHDLLVTASVLESLSGSCCPYHLKAQQSYL